MIGTFVMKELGYENYSREINPVKQSWKSGVHQNFEYSFLAVKNIDTR